MPSKQPSRVLTPFISNEIARETATICWKRSGYNVPLQRTEGRPKFTITREQLVNLRDTGMAWASEITVSRTEILKTIKFLASEVSILSLVWFSKVYRWERRELWNIFPPFPRILEVSGFRLKRKRSDRSLLYAKNYESSHETDP